MKIMTILLALLMQGLFINVYGTTYSIVETTNQPPTLSMVRGAIVPMLRVSAVGSDKQFPPPLHLVIQQTGNTQWQPGTNSTINLYIGDDYKSISWGPFVCNPFGQTVVGPIYLDRDVPREVVISAQFENDLSGMQGQVFGLEVVGAAVDGYRTEISDKVLFTSSFPIRGEFHQVETNASVGKLAIQNITQLAPISIGTNQINLGQFRLSVENKDVEIPYLPISFTLSSDGDSAQIKSVIVVDQDGTVLGGPEDVRPFDKVSSGSIYFRSKINLSIGNHTFTVKGIVGNKIPDHTTLTLSWEWFGNATDSIGYGIIPTIDNTANGVILKQIDLNQYVWPASVTITKAPVGFNYVNLVVYGQPNTRYNLEESTDTITWKILRMMEMGDEGANGLKVDTESAEYKFYRLVRIP